MRSLVALFSLCVSFTAAAVPLQLTHQGRIYDSAGSPLVGLHDVTVALYDAPSGGAALWSETISSELDAGVFSIVLGGAGGVALDSGLFDGSVRWVGLSVDGGQELPQRIALVSVPYAMRAESAAVADALSAPIAWGDLVGTPPDADTLGALVCADAQVPTWQGSGWVCASPVPLTVDVSTLSGTVSVDNLPVGTGPTTVAAGDHAHSFSDITGELGLNRTNGDLDVSRLTGDLPLTQTSGNLDVSRLTGNLPLTQTTGSLDLTARTSGNLDVARVSGNLPLTQTTGNLDVSRLTGTIPATRLPVGTAANEVAAGNHTHAASAIVSGTLDAARLPTGVPGNWSAGGNLVAAGGVQAGTTTATCTSSLYGMLRFASGKLEVCAAAGWRALWSDPLGTSQAGAGLSCKHILTQTPGAPDGTYWIDPNGGNTSDAFQVYCEDNPGPHKNLAA